MKFRIVRCGDYYKPQVLKTNGEYEDIGNRYCFINDAKYYCRVYKDLEESRIVEEFEL